MQITMTLEACCRCGQPIAPGEPAMQTASVDIIGGRAVSSPVKSYHLKGPATTTCTGGSPFRTQHRRLTRAAHEAPPSLYRETAGPRFVWTQHPYKGRKVVKMQITMTLEACCRCGQPIAPGEPAMQTASVDIIGGRAVSSPVKSYHLKGRCYDDVHRRESLPNAA